MKTTLVKVNHSGSCEGIYFTVNEPVVLPENVLTALGKDNYEVIEGDYESQKDHQELLKKATDLQLVNTEGKTIEQLKGMIAEREAEITAKQNADKEKVADQNTQENPVTSAAEQASEEKTK